MGAVVLCMTFWANLAFKPGARLYEGILGWVKGQRSHPSTSLSLLYRKWYCLIQISCSMAALHPRSSQPLTSPTTQRGCVAVRVPYMAFLGWCGGKMEPRLEVREEHDGYKQDLIWTMRTGTFWVQCCTANIWFGWTVNRAVFLESLPRLVGHILHQPQQNTQHSSKGSDTALSQCWRLSTSSHCWELFYRALCCGNASWNRGGLQQQQQQQQLYIESYQRRPNSFFLMLLQVRANWIQSHLKMDYTSRHAASQFLHQHDCSGTRVEEKQLRSRTDGLEEQLTMYPPAWY